MIILNFSTSIDEAFFGIITSVAEDQACGAYPAAKGMLDIVASNSAIEGCELPAM